MSTLGSSSSSSSSSSGYSLFSCPPSSSLAAAPLVPLNAPSTNRAIPTPRSPISVLPFQHSIAASRATSLGSFNAFNREDSDDDGDDEDEGVMSDDLYDEDEDEEGDEFGSFGESDSEDEPDYVPESDEPDQVGHLRVIMEIIQPAARVYEASECAPALDGGDGFMPPIVVKRRHVELGAYSWM